MATILVIDDEPANRDLVRTVLQYRNHRVLEAADGAEGLETTRREKPDLVIADILMPTMDGLEFVRRLRAELDLAESRVLFYTAAYNEKEIRALAADCGVLNTLTKPAEPQVIIDIVESALGIRPAVVAAPSEQFDRDHLQLMTDKLSQKVAQLENVTLRLEALVDIGRRMAAEPNADRLIDVACRLGREIIGATQAGIGFIDAAENVVRYELHGLDAGAVSALTRPAADGSVLRAILGEGRPVRLSNPSGDPTAVGFPGDHPPIHSFLGVPLATPANAYGWIGFRNKIGHQEFTEQDEKIALSLGSQLAVAYENTQRFAEIQHHAEDLEKKVKARTADLQRSNAELEQFAYVASHDLQEPLRKILGFTELLAENLKNKLDDTGKEYMAYVADAAGRMRELIQDLLAFSRAGKQTRALATVDSLAVLSRVLLDLQPTIEEQGAIVSNDRLPTVSADVTQLAQLFQNLIGNALKYRSSQPPRIHIGARSVSRDSYLVSREEGLVAREERLVAREAYLVSREEGGSSPAQRDTNNEIRDTRNEIRDTPETLWLFSVRDNGMGIDPKYAERIFRIFQRLHTRAQYPGTGIGLAICKKIVEGLGGRIWVESAAGQGSTFYFTLPAAAA